MFSATACSTVAPKLGWARQKLWLNFLNALTFWHGVTGRWGRSCKNFLMHLLYSSPCAGPYPVWHRSLAFACWDRDCFDTSPFFGIFLIQISRGGRRWHSYQIAVGLLSCHALATNHSHHHTYPIHPISKQRGKHRQCFYWRRPSTYLQCHGICGRSHWQKSWRPGIEFP